MILKKGASLEGVTGNTRHAIEVVDQVYAAYGYGLVITSGTEGDKTDGVHREDSKHYTGDAFDCRIRFVTNEAGLLDVDKVKSIAKTIREKLGVNYDVLVEKDHIHVEYDPKSQYGALASDLKRLIDMVFKFIGDFIPFYRSLESLVKSIVGKIKK